MSSSVADQTTMGRSKTLNRSSGSGQGAASTATQSQKPTIQSYRMKLDVVLSMINDPATAAQHERHHLELIAALAPFRNGFPPAVALDGIPQVISFLVARLAQADSLTPQEQEIVSSSLSLLLQHCAYPIVCTTLDDQRKHDSALQQILESVSLVLTVPQRSLRLAALIVLRQIFSFVRAQCSDDMTPQTVQFHKKKEYQKSITLIVIQRLLALWGAALKEETEVGAGNSPTKSEEGSESEGEADLDGSTRSAAGQGLGRNCGPELVAICKAVQELSYYRTMCVSILESGGADLILDTMDRCAPGERALSIALELLWNILALDPDAANVVGSQHNVDILYKCFTQTLQLGYMVKERELRNDFIIVCALLVRHEPNIEFFHQFLPLLLDLSCGPELGRTNSLINPTYHNTTKPEELQMKKLTWDLLDRLCANAEFAKEILDWGFINAIISYINVRCETPAVVRWTTLQLLDLQAHSLRTLSSLAVMGANYFSAAGGADIVHEYIAECPDVQLRNLGVSVLARTATTDRRRELVSAGSIPLALALLRDTGDNALRVECLNLLADVVDRQPDLQHAFLECDGVRTVLPLMTLNPDYYTELLDTVTFAAVDCIWSCVFGSEANEGSFLDNNGLHSLLTVIETCQPWMLGFPLSCLADFLQNPRAVQIFREWVSPKSGRSATQLLLSFWTSAPANADASTLDAGRTVGLATIGGRTKPALKPRPDQTTQPLIDQDLTIQRVGLQEVPADIQFLVQGNVIRFKLHVAMNLVGFDDHKELDDLERGTMVTIGRFIDLCKDEIWASVETSLQSDQIRPTTPDAEKLRLLRLAAEQRSAKLIESNERHRNRYAQRQAESEITFYKSLIKKTEEKRVGPKKVVGLSITEAKIRKAQMLKQSYKSSLAKQESKDEPTEEEIANAEQQRIQQEKEEEEKAERSGIEQTHRLERWGPGQRAMTDTEYGILQALNNVRTNPLSLIPLIEEKLKFLNEAGNAFHVPNRDPETCIEGAAAYHEAIDFIKTVRPLVTLLDVPVGMLYAARDHVRDLSRRMDVSQDGSDGSTPLTRLQRYGKPGTKFAQLLALGQSDPVEMLMNLIVDDGVKSRIDRKSIFDPDIRVCGISIGPHSIHEVVCVIVVAQEYAERPLAEQTALHRKLEAAKV